MELNAEFDVNLLFDLKNVFQSRIIDVCMARNDIAYVNSLLDKNSGSSNYHNCFLFRQQIAMIREALYLISKLFAEHEKQLKEFNNAEAIYVKYDNLRPKIDDFEFQPGTVLREFLAPVRHMISHYKDDEKTPQYENVADQNIKGDLTYYGDCNPNNSYGRIYSFAEATFYRSIMKKWKEYRNLDSDDIGDLFKDFVLWYRETVVETLQLLDTIFDGYFEMNFDFEQTDNTYKVVKKN